jgi:hypothetical protein
VIGYNLVLLHLTAEIVKSRTVNTYSRQEQVLLMTRRALKRDEAKRIMMTIRNVITAKTMDETNDEVQERIDVRHAVVLTNILEAEVEALRRPAAVVMMMTVLILIHEEDGADPYGVETGDIIVDHQDMTGVPALVLVQMMTDTCANVANEKVTQNDG